MFKYLAFLDNDLREHLPALDAGIYSGQLISKDECSLNPCDFKYVHTL